MTQLKKWIHRLLLILMLCTNSAYAENKTIKIVFVGDIMLDDLPGKYIQDGNDPFASFSALFKSADLTIGNLECVVGTSGVAEDKPFVLRAHPRVLPVLKKHFSALSLANNHSGDFGPQAFSSMLDLLDASGIKYFGGGRNLQEAYAPIIFDIKGKRIALLAYNLFFPRSFEALDDRPGNAWGEDDYVREGIKRARNIHQADIVITYPHWGWENEKIASANQVALAHLMIDSGADAVIGGHPHVTQNIEIYKGKTIFYSLGNFVFDSFDTEETNTGWAVEMTIQADSTISWNIYEAKLDGNGIPRNNGKIKFP
jgi:poly-gamma-glutamate synthesis protein (capsule biosynthesis protein)